MGRSQRPQKVQADTKTTGKEEQCQDQESGAAQDQAGRLQQQAEALIGTVPLRPSSTLILHLQPSRCVCVNPCGSLSLSPGPTERGGRARCGQRLRGRQHEQRLRLRGLQQPQQPQQEEDVQEQTQEEERSVLTPERSRSLRSILS